MIACKKKKIDYNLFIMRKFLNKIKIKNILILLALTISIIATAVYAVGGFRTVKFQPGETLNPDCAPGEENCTVDVSPKNITPYYAFDGEYSLVDKEIVDKKEYIDKPKLIKFNDSILAFFISGNDLYYQKFDLNGNKIGKNKLFISNINKDGLQIKKVFNDESFYITNANITSHSSRKITFYDKNLNKITEKNFNFGKVESIGKFNDKYILLLDLYNISLGSYKYSAFIEKKVLDSNFNEINTYKILEKINYGGRRYNIDDSITFFADFVKNNNKTYIIYSYWKYDNWGFYFSNIYASSDMVEIDNNGNIISSKNLSTLPIINLVQKENQVYILLKNLEWDSRWHHWTLSHRNPAIMNSYKI